MFYVMPKENGLSLCLRVCTRNTYAAMLTMNVLYPILYKDGVDCLKT